MCSECEQLIETPDLMADLMAALAAFFGGTNYEEEK